jgi:putative FmdB family regulatory protein
MPVYEFECRTCGAVTEEEYPISSNIERIICPVCKRVALKIISAGSFIVLGHNAANGYSKESEGL